MVEISEGFWTHRSEWAQGPSDLTVKQLISRANAACDRDEYASALLDLNHVLAQHPDFADIRNRAGFCRAMLGDAEGALQEFGHALRLNPDYAEAHLNRALVLNDLTRFDEAREAFARVQPVDERGRDPFPAEAGNRIALGHAELGDLYMEAEQPVAAIAEYGKALQVRPAFVDVRARLARALLYNREIDKALAELKRVVAERPSYLDARLNLGTALRRRGRLDEAVQEWRACLELEPGNERAVAFLASVDTRTGEMPPPDTSREEGG